MRKILFCGILSSPFIFLGALSNPSFILSLIVVATSIKTVNAVEKSSCFPVVFDFESTPINDQPFAESGRINFIKTEIGGDTMYMNEMTLDIDGGEFTSVIPPSHGALGSCKVSQAENHLEATCDRIALFQRGHKNYASFKFTALRNSDSAKLIPKEVRVDFLKNRTLSNINDCMYFIETAEKEKSADTLIAFGVAGGFGAILLIYGVLRKRGYCVMSNDRKNKPAAASVVTSYGSSNLVNNKPKTQLLEIFLTAPAKSDDEESRESGPISLSSISK